MVGERMSTPERIAPTSFATVIEAPEHAAEVETVTDALAESVGIQVRRFGGLGAFSTVSIRGSASNQVQVYLDGIPMSRAQNETVNLADLPIDSLDRIEVYRGTVPVAFGISGPGGVVNLVTRPPAAEPSTDLSASYGSFDTRKVVAFHSRRLHRLSILGHVAYLGSQGDFTYRDDQTPENPSDPNPELRRENNAFDSAAAILKASCSIDDRTTLDATSELFWKHQGVPGIGRFTSMDSSFEELRSLNFLRLQRRQLLAGALDASATVFGIYSNEQFSDKLGRTGRGFQDRDDDTVSVGASSAFTCLATPAHTADLFSELSHEAFKPRNEVQARPGGPEQRRLRWSLAFQDQASLLGQRLLVVPSIRYERIEDDVTASFTPAGEPMGRETTTHDLWGAGLGLQVALFEGAAIKANLGRYQRAPNFSELFGNGASVRGNPALDPETAINRDIGFVLSRDGLPWNGRGRVEYAYFHNDHNELIALVQTSPTVARAQNIGGARIRGHELVLNLDLLSRVAADLNYTHQEAEDRSSDATFRGQRLPFRPADELYWRLTLYGAPGKLYHEINFVGSNYTRRLNIDRNRVDARTIHTAGFAFDPASWLTLRFEARNLTDNVIRDVADFPLPGRSFFGSVAVRF